MPINLEELQLIFDKILIHLKKNGIKEFDPKKDMYWYIPKEVCYNPYKTPAKKDLSIGQVSDDISELKNIINGKNEPTLYHLIWLASVLRALGDQGY